MCGFEDRPMATVYRIPRRLKTFFFLAFSPSMLFPSSKACNMNALGQCNNP